MLTISAEQFDSLGTGQRDRSLKAIAARLRQDFPQQTAPLSEPELQALIELGIKNAAVYGLVTEGQVRVYCGMMLRHGRDFDVDARLPWAGDILEDDRLAPAEKLARLDEVQLFLDRTPSK